MATNNFWDRRVNLDNKPSVEIRTQRIIMQLMEKEDLAMGVAIEKIMKNPSLYDEILSEIAEYDKTILPNK